MRWCNKVSFSCFPDGKAIKALVCGGCAASAEDSEQALHSECVHWELSLPMGFFALGFSSQYCVWWGKKGGGNAVLIFVISVFLKRENKTPAVNTVGNQSNPLVGFFFFFPSSPLSSLSRSVKSRACVKTRSCRIGERLT